MQRFKVHKEGVSGVIRYYPLRYGGYYSHVAPSGSEVYFPSQEEAEAYFNKLEVSEQIKKQPLDKEE